MKTIIAGSRGITDYWIVRQAVIDSDLWHSHRHNLEVVCGMAKGVDLLGKEFAENNGLTVHEFPADWDKYGKRAGHLRNIEMGKFSEALVAVWDGESRGTKQMIDWAIENGLYVYVHNLKEGLKMWFEEGKLWDQK